MKDYLNYWKCKLKSDFFIKEEDFTYFVFLEKKEIKIIKFRGKTKEWNGFIQADILVSFIKKKTMVSLIQD